MKKIAKVLMSITCLVLLTVFTTGCADKIDKKTLRQEQERLAEYTIQKYEDVQKIEFKSFEQDTSTRTWAADAIINDTYYITFSINKIGDNEIGIGHHVEDSGGRVLKQKSIENVDSNNVKIIYWEG